MIVRVARQRCRLQCILGMFAAVAMLAHPSGLRAAPPVGNPQFGLAHVDVMELHVERGPGGAVQREVLPPADLAQRFQRAVDAASRWNRWSLYWDLVESGGRRDWTVVDGMVARDVEAGLGTLAILQGTPQEYATGGFVGAPLPRVGGRGQIPTSGLGIPRALAPQASPPAGLGAPIFLRRGGGTTDDPADAEAVNPANPWAVFVDAAVERYRPSGELSRARGWGPLVGVRAWEIGNEPNLPFFWSGTAAQYARYLEVAYLVIKRRDVAAVVIHGGIADDASATPWYNQFLDALLARAAVSPLPARHGYYFDKAGWHWYTYPSLLQTGPERARALLSAKGLPVKPVWVTEMGVPIWNEHPGPCWDPTSPWRATAAEQAGYVWQATTEGVAAGVEALVFFQLYDDCGNGPASYDAFGLVRNHAANQCWTPPSGQACWRLDPGQVGVPRPAYHALRAVAEEMRGAALLWRPPREADGWQRVLFYRPPDTRVMVLWNHFRTTRTVEVYATGTEAEQLELGESGQLMRTTVQPEGGRLRPTLPGATNRNNPGNQSPVMAGRPVIIVERDAYGPFRAEVRPLPEVSTTTVDLTVAAADGGTGVGAFRVWFALEPPTSAADWRALLPEQPWPAPPLAGEVVTQVVLEPGRTYYFAAQARDRAGNWSQLPVTAQASTSVSGPTPPPGTLLPTATPSVSATAVATSTALPTVAPPPSATPSPIHTASPSATPVPSASVPPTRTPWPTWTPGPPPDLPQQIYLPLAVRGARLAAFEPSAARETTMARSLGPPIVRK